MPEFDPELTARTCVGCRSRADKSQLLRVVLREDACIPDERARLPGRGAYLHRDARCLGLADKRRAFPRAFRVPGPLDLTALEHHLHEHDLHEHDLHEHEHDPEHHLNEQGPEHHPEHDPGATAAGHDTRAGR